MKHAFGLMIAVELAILFCILVLVREAFTLAN